MNDDPYPADAKELEVGPRKMTRATVREAEDLGMLASCGLAIRPLIEIYNDVDNTGIFSPVADKREKPVGTEDIKNHEYLKLHKQVIQGMEDERNRKLQPAVIAAFLPTNAAEIQVPFFLSSKARLPPHFVNSIEAVKANDALVALESLVVHDGDVWWDPNKNTSHVKTDTLTSYQTDAFFKYVSEKVLSVSFPTKKVDEFKKGVDLQMFGALLTTARIMSVAKTAREPASGLKRLVSSGDSQVWGTHEPKRGKEPNTLEFGFWRVTTAAPGQRSIFYVGDHDVELVEYLDLVKESFGSEDFASAGEISNFYREAQMNLRSKIALFGRNLFSNKNNPDDPDKSQETLDFGALGAGEILDAVRRFRAIAYMERFSIREANESVVSRKFAPTFLMRRCSDHAYMNNDYVRMGLMSVGGPTFTSADQTQFVEKPLLECGRLLLRYKRVKVETIRTTTDENGNKVEDNDYNFDDASADYGVYDQKDADEEEKAMEEKFKEQMKRKAETPIYEEAIETIDLADDLDMSEVDQYTSPETIDAALTNSISKATGKIVAVTPPRLHDETVPLDKKTMERVNALNVALHDRSRPNTTGTRVVRRNRLATSHPEGVCKDRIQFLRLQLRGEKLENLEGVSFVGVTWREGDLPCLTPPTSMIRRGMSSMQAVYLGNWCTRNYGSVRYRHRVGLPKFRVETREKNIPLSASTSLKEKFNSLFYDYADGHQPEMISKTNFDAIRRERYYGYFDKFIYRSLNVPIASEVYKLMAAVVCDRYLVRILWRIHYNTYGINMVNKHQRDRTYARVLKIEEVEKAAGSAQGAETYAKSLKKRETLFTSDFPHLPLLKPILIARGSAKAKANGDDVDIVDDAQFPFVETPSAIKATPKRTDYVRHPRAGVPAHAHSAAPPKGPTQSTENYSAPVFSIVGCEGYSWENPTFPLPYEEDLPANFTTRWKEADVLRKKLERSRRMMDALIWVKNDVKTRLASVSLYGWTGVDHPVIDRPDYTDVKIQEHLISEETGMSNNVEINGPEAHPRKRLSFKMTMPAQEEAFGWDTAPTVISSFAQHRRECTYDTIVKRDGGSASVAAGAPSGGASGVTVAATTPLPPQYRDSDDYKKAIKREQRDEEEAKRRYAEITANRARSLGKPPRTVPAVPPVPPVTVENKKQKTSATTTSDDEWEDQDLDI